MNIVCSFFGFSFPQSLLQGNLYVFNHILLNSLPLKSQAWKNGEGFKVRITLGVRWQYTNNQKIFSLYSKSCYALVRTGCVLTQAHSIQCQDWATPSRARPIFGMDWTTQDHDQARRGPLTSLYEIGYELDTWVVPLGSLHPPVPIPRLDHHYALELVRGQFK